MAEAAAPGDGGVSVAAASAAALPAVASLPVAPPGQIPMASAPNESSDAGAGPAPELGAGGAQNAAAANGKPMREFWAAVVTTIAVLGVRHDQRITQCVLLMLPSLFLCRQAHLDRRIARRGEARGQGQEAPGGNPHE